MSNTKAYLFLFFGMVCFGSATPVSKLVVDQFPVFVAGALRVAMAFLVLLPFVKFAKIKTFKGKDLWLLTGIGIIGVVGFTAFLLYGMKNVSGVTGSIIMSATPAITAALSYVFFKDKFTWRKYMALGLAIAGILIMRIFDAGKGDESGTWWGVLLVALAIICEAGYTLKGKGLSNDYKPVEIACFSAFIGFIGFLPFGIWQYDPGLFSEVSGADYTSLIWYGVGTMGLGSVLWYKGVKEVDGSIAAAFMGVMPVSALVLSYWLLGESFQWIHMLGFAMVFAGVVLIIRAHQKMEEE